VFQECAAGHANIADPPRQKRVNKRFWDNGREPRGMAGNDPIIIAGGGLGGLTAALALARRGFAVRVLEGAPEFGAIGYGIQFGPNVFHVLDRLGLMEAVLGVADLPA